MIIFYKHQNCPVCDAFEEKMVDIVLAHEIRPLSDAAPKHSTFKDAIIVEGKRTAAGHEEIKKFMTEISKAMELWQKFQSDSCYINDDDTIC